MKQDFGSNFLRTFNPNFANTYDTTLRFSLSQQEEERQRQEQLKAQQEQMGILNQLVSGKLQSGSYRGKFAPLDMSLNQQDQTNLVGRASDDTLQRYKILSDMNKPKEEDYLAPNMDKSSPTILQWNKSTRKLEDTGQPNPLYEPEQATTFEYKKANEFEGLEDYPSDYKVRITKKGDKITEQTIPFSPTQQKINIITNQPYNQLSDYTRKTLQDYVAEADRYTRILSQKPNKDNLYEIYDKWGQLEREVTREEVEIAKKNALDGMASFVNENLGEGVSDYNALKSTLGTNPKSLWTSIYNAYVKDLSDKKDDAWFETAKYKFYIDFGYDPIGRYGLGGTTKTGKK